MGPDKVSEVMKVQFGTYAQDVTQAPQTTSVQFALEPQRPPAFAGMKALWSLQRAVPLRVIRREQVQKRKSSEELGTRPIALTSSRCTAQLPTEWHGRQP